VKSPDCDLIGFAAIFGVSATCAFVSKPFDRRDSLDLFYNLFLQMPIIEELKNRHHRM
jgi:hypothetical protein